jgi:hypothetical protein
VRLIFCLLLFQILAPAQNLETAALGGPCLPEDPADTSWFQLLTRHNEATKRGDRKGAVVLARQIVRARCSVEYWWFKLAESSVDLGRPAEAVTVLDALYHRGNNSIDEQLQTAGSTLHKLVDMDAFRESPLAARLAEDRRAAAVRRKQAQARMATEPHPAIRYVAKGACPFECCRYGSWTAEEDTVLFDRPDGIRQVGRVAKGETVQAVTGEVHLRPEAVRVRSDGPLDAREGSIVYLLDNLGEGYARVWVAAKIVEADFTGVRNQCTFAGPGCWGELVNPPVGEHSRDAVWWVQMKTRGGITGWTKDTKHFGGMDGCG